MDDNDWNLYQLRVLLGAGGYQVVTAVNGVEALREARQNPPGLIISDLLMPVMDGFTLCRELKKDEGLRQIPLVFYTATYTDERDREFALSLGAEECLAKPVEPEVLMRTIREIIQQAGHSPAPPANPPDAPQLEETEYLKQHNETLLRKLEAKTQQLEQANRELRRDIAERKRAEEELRFRNVLLSTQQEASIDGILVVDAEARIVSYNRRLVQMWGLPAKLISEGVDEPVLQFVTAQMADPRSFLQRIQYLYEHPQETSRDELVLADGRVFDRYSAPMFGPEERYYGRVWYIRDITESKRAEESNAQLATAVEHAAESICITDPNGVILYVNPAFGRIAGCTRQEALGQTPRIFESGKQDAEVYRRMWAKLIAGEVWSGRMINKRKDGTLYEVDASISPVRDSAGKIINYVAIERDVSGD